MRFVLTCALVTILAVGVIAAARLMLQHPTQHGETLKLDGPKP